MKAKAALALLAATLLLGTSTPALADHQDFVLLNETGLRIDEVYIEASSEAEWGDDMLAGESLESGKALELNIDGYGQDCDFDVLVKDETGREWTFDSVQLCGKHAFVLGKQGETMTFSANQTATLE